MNRRSVAIIIWLFLSLVMLPAPGLSGTHTWTGTVSDYWNIADNWDSAAVPGRDDKAIINNGDTVLINSGSPLIHQVEVSSASALNISAALWFQSPLPDNYILNDGTIWVGNSVNNGNISCWGDTVLLTGAGTLILGGYPAIRLTGTVGVGSFSNTAGHTIRGGGKILASLVNQGQVIGDNGILWIQCPVDNTGGTMSASGSGSVLRFHAAQNLIGGQINPQDGKVVLAGSVFGDLALGPGAVEIGADDSPGWGSTFLNTVTLASGTTVTVREDSSLWGDPSGNSTTLVNNGAISMASTGGMPTYLLGNLTLQGPGTLTMGGPGNVADGTGYNLINSAPHLIQGSGSITNIVNDGAIMAKGGTLTVSGVTGAGMVDVDNGATLSVTPMNLQTGYLTLAPQATLSVNITSGDAFIDLKGNFTFFQNEPVKWNWGTSWLKMSGGDWAGGKQTLEVGCRDDGPNDSGYTNNFVIPELQVTGANTYVSLVDVIDNGQWPSREALYVTALQVTPGATLNLNGLKLYAKRGGSTVNRVRAGEGSLYGGGKIIDKGGFLPAIDLMLLD